MGYSSGTHFLSKNKDFDNGNSLRMTEQEDISPCYITKRGNLEPLNKLFRSRFTVFTGLRCYTTWRIMPQKIIVQLNLSLVTAKTCSSFLNYVTSTSLDITLTVSSSEKKKKSCSIDGKCPNFSLRLFLANARKADVIKFWVWNAMRPVLSGHPRGML